MAVAPKAGVPNWLDDAGYQTGAIQVRWENCSNWPVHKVTRIKTAEVRNYLPSDTSVITAEARDESIIITGLARSAHDDFISRQLSRVGIGITTDAVIC